MAGNCSPLCTNTVTFVLWVSEGEKSLDVHPEVSEGQAGPTSTPQLLSSPRCWQCSPERNCLGLLNWSPAWGGLMHLCCLCPLVGLTSLYVSCKGARLWIRVGTPAWKCWAIVWCLSSIYHPLQSAFSLPSAGLKRQSVFSYEWSVSRGYWGVYRQTRIALLDEAQGSYSSAFHFP